MTDVNISGWEEWTLISSPALIDIRAIRHGDDWVILVSGLSSDVFFSIDIGIRESLVKHAVRQAIAAERTAAPDDGGAS